MRNAAAFLNQLPASCRFMCVSLHFHEIGQLLISRSIIDRISIGCTKFPDRPTIGYRSICILLVVAGAIIKWCSICQLFNTFLQYEQTDTHTHTRTHKRPHKRFILQVCPLDSDLLWCSLCSHSLPSSDVHTISTLIEQYRSLIKLYLRNAQRYSTPCAPSQNFCTLSQDRRASPQHSA